MKKTLFRKKLLPILLAVLVLLGLGAGAAGYARARFRTEIMRTGTTSWNTQLASGFTLQMNEIDMEEDGTYRSVPGATVTEATGFLIPGTEIPQIPYLEIKDKSDIPCYLYVEVLADNEEQKAAFQLTEDWTLLDVKGMDGGDVYVYRNGEAITSAVGDDFTVPVLKDGIRTDRSPAEKDAGLSFCGYLIQVTEGTAAEVFSQKTRG